MKRILLIFVVLAVIILTFFIGMKKKRVDFTSQVKPILNRNCIACHGGVRQKGGFSVLFRDEALAKLKSGKYAIIPGDPEHSEMIRRINLSDPEDRMPYKHDPLSKEDISILRRWIEEGAPWGQHWAYIPVKPVPLPRLKTFFGLFDKKDNWAKNEVDLFIEQKFDEQGLKPARRADRQTLLRRASLDITGMPPGKDLEKRFLDDSSGQAWPRLVDSLLASPHYGEKWTSMWLDLARYADTKGYERDDSRTIWRYRDWLIRSFNEDKPYNVFLTEQIAGDLLPGATDDQFIATAFHRNTMTNDEGGTDNEEFRTAAVLDRVNTTWQALMGTSFGCVQCHSHPYDPFKHEEYYKFMAFFNDSRDEDTEADYPLLRNYNDSMQMQVDAVVNWVRENVSAGKSMGIRQFLKTWQPSYNSLTCDSFLNSELADTKWLALRNEARCRLRHVDLENKNQLIFRFSSSVPGGIWKIFIDSAEGIQIAQIPLSPTKDNWTIGQVAIPLVNGMHDLYFTYGNPYLKKPEDNGVLFDWFYFTEDFPGKEKAGYAAEKNKFEQLLKAAVPTTPVMMDNPSDMHRPSYVFERGNWLVKGQEVEPGVPGSLNPFPPGAPHNRLGLAAWIVSTQNPLTARTMVNRVWEQIYGTGLVETLEDLGSQGSSPTHRELLDWLSYQFMYTDNWSIKKLIRRILLSATYQQDSRIKSGSNEKDPFNKYYARGMRVRLSAEQIRDQALCISGAFYDSLYGPSVYPWQPKGIWLSPWNGKDWIQSSGKQQYRRALYTYWKRSAAYPSMITFDGISREVCTARRIRTNTPLQALATLNDSAYIDMARLFAKRMQSEAPGNVNEQISEGYRWATLHPIGEKNLNIFLSLYREALNQFESNPDKACEMMGGRDGDYKPETAALTVVANAILNLDEVVTKN